MSDLQKTSIPNIEITHIASMIDHAILQPIFSRDQMAAEIETLLPYPIASVCIKPWGVPLAARLLAGTRIGVGTVIGFPHGSSKPSIKSREAEEAFADGAGEVDMVVNIGQALGEDWAAVADDIGAVLTVCRAHGGLLKVIFETDLLPDDRHIIALCEICTELGVDYVKTSTGFGFVKGADGRYGSVGATEHDIALMRKHAGPNVGVKASGGVRSLQDAIRFAALGATRLGTTSTHAILGAIPAAAAAGGY